MIEYIVGNNKSEGKKITPNSMPTSSILFSENYSKMIFYMVYNKNTNNLCGIEIDNDIVIGTKHPKSKSHEIIFDKDSHHLDSMEIQEVLNQDPYSNFYWKYITYVKIVYKNQIYEMGMKRPVEKVKLENEKNISLEYEFLNPITVNHPFFISGILLNDLGISSFQIIQFNNKNHINNENCYLYKQSIIGIIEGKTEDGKFNIPNMVMNHNIITCENIEPLKLLDLLYERIRKWTYGRSVISTSYTKIVSLIDEAIVEKEYDVIHTVFRIERYLRSLIQRDIPFEKERRFEEDIGLTIKLHKIWFVLCRSMMLVQNIQDANISLNCYQVAHLSNNRTHYIYALVTFICQIGLIFLFGFSIIDVDNNRLFPLLESKIIIPLIYIYTCYIIKKQIFNTIKFMNVFPDIKPTFMGFCDLFSNLVCSALVIFLNFFLLAYSSSRIDIVLNSLAALFIIEMDDSMVFLSDNAKDNLFKQKIINLFNQDLKRIPNIYFEESTWKYDDIYKLNEENIIIDRDFGELVKKENVNQKSINIEIV